MSMKNKKSLCASEPHMSKGVYIMHRSLEIAVIPCHLYLVVNYTKERIKDN